MVLMALVALMALMALVAPDSTDCTDGRCGRPDGPGEPGSPDGCQELRSRPKSLSFLDLICRITVVIRSLSVPFSNLCLRKISQPSRRG